MREFELAKHLSTANKAIIDRWVKKFHDNREGRRSAIIQSVFSDLIQFGYSADKLLIGGR